MTSSGTALACDEPLVRLLALAEAGDQNAWTELVKLHLGPLERFAAARGADDPEGVANYALSRLAGSISEFRGDNHRSLTAYLQRIAANRIIDEHRRRTVPQAPLDDQVDPVDRVSSSFDDHLAGSDWAERLLSELSDDQQDVLRLRILEQRSVPETAEILGKQPAAIHSLQYRGLRKLRILVLAALTIAAVVAIRSLLNSGPALSTDPLDTIPDSTTSVPGDGSERSAGVFVPGPDRANVDEGVNQSRLAERSQTTVAPSPVVTSTTADPSATSIPASSVTVAPSIAAVTTAVSTTAVDPAAGPLDPPAISVTTAPPPSPAPPSSPSFVALDESAPDSVVGPSIHDAGSLTAWIRLGPDPVVGDHLIWATSDSRLVLFVDTFQREATGPVTRIGARAGGNQNSSESGGAWDWPDASIHVNNDGLLDDLVTARPMAYGQWHHIAMTWSGYPEGTVEVFLDGVPVDSHDYDSRYDNGQPLPNSYSVGFRPTTWPATGGVFGSTTGGGTMRLREGVAVSTTPRLYGRPLTVAELGADRAATEP